jgi:DNA polymerase-1
MILTFDTEADGYRDEATRLWCIVAKDKETGEVHQFGPDEIQQGIILLGKATLLIGHNIINYDLPLMERLYDFRFMGLVRDTLVKSRTLLSDRPRPAGTNAGTHSIEAWGYRLGRGKPEHTDWTQFSPEMLHRCTEDVEITCMVDDALMTEERSFNVNWTEALELEQDVAEIMTEQEIYGVPFNDAGARDLLGTLLGEISSIDVELVPQLPQVPLSKSRQSTWPKVQFKKDGTPSQAAIKYYGPEFTTYRTDLIVKTEPINLGSEKQVKEYLQSIGWVPTEWNFKKGVDGKPIRDQYGDKVKTSPKLTLDSLESCQWPEGQATFGEKVVRRLMLAHRAGMVEGFLRDVRPDGRISAETTPMGTPTGRMTHRKVVNVPRATSPLGAELRGLFGTDPGYVRIGADLKSCQLRGLCHYMGDEEFQRQVLEGDVHTYVQELAYLDTRDQGKKLVYTTLFGAGVHKIATDLGLTLEEAKRVKESFFKNLPKLKELLDRLSREWKEKGYLTGLDGRVIWVRAEHMLLVYLMQGLEAVVMKYFLREVWFDVALRGIVAHQVQVNHDEVQYLVREENVDEFIRVAEDCIKAANSRFGLHCPQAIDVKRGSTWAECH